MSFSPLNLYTFAAARGHFLRPDVQALLNEAPVRPHDLDVRREAEALRKRLDSLLFAELRPQADAAPPLASNVVRLRP